MIKWIINIAIANRGFTLLLAVLLLVSGLVGAQRLAVDAIPDLSEVQVIVKTSYPGQSPEVVEAQVSYPLSTALLSVPKAKDVRGFSFFGDSFIYVIFEEGTDPYWARSRVLESLAQVGNELPAGVTPSIGPDASGVGWVYQYALVDETEQTTLAELTSLHDNFIRYRLQSVDGVAEIATVGGMVQQYQVIVDPNQLRAYNLSLQDVEQAIKGGNQEIGASVIEMAEAEYMVKLSGYVQSLEDLRAIPLGLIHNGASLQLGDVAQLRIGPEMRRGVAELNGAGEVVGGIVVMRAGENALDTINGVKAAISQLAPSLPEGVEIKPVYDRSQLIERAQQNLIERLGEELFVVALICGIFLWHFRSTLVIVISLPLGIVAALGIMSAQGINANIMSLSGIAIAIGAMVDGAIVMVENLHRHLSAKRGRSHWACVRDASIEVGPPLFFSLLIITVSFLPVFALEGASGKLFAPLAYTKTYAMAVAAGLAITVVPVLMGYLIRGEFKAPKHSGLGHKMVTGYQWLLAKMLRTPVLWILAFLAFGASAWYPAQQLGQEFMPPLNEGDILYMPTVDAGISIGKARQLLQQTDRLIAQIPEVEQVFGKVGRANTATDPAPLTMIETVIQLKPREQWRAGLSYDDLIAELDQQVALPGLSNAWVMPIKTRIDMLSTGIKTPVGLKVSGPDLTEIEALSQQIETLLSSDAQTQSVYAERTVGGRYVDIDIDRDKAARYGLNIRDIHEVVRYAVGGMNVSYSVEGVARYPINLRYPQHYRSSDDRLAALPIVTASGARVALGDVARVTIKEGPGAIKTENGLPTAYVYITPEDDDIAGYVARTEALLSEQLNVTPGYSWQWAGQFEYLAEAKQTLQLIIPLTLTIIIVLLYLAFRSTTDVLLIAACLPLGVSGGVWALWLLNYNLSIAVAVGFIALAGLVVELGVLMLSYLKLSEAKGATEEAVVDGAEDNSSAAVSTLEADTAIPTQLGERAKINENLLVQTSVLEGASRRLRPICMTAATVIFSLLAIMQSSGSGSETMQRIAAPMVGGMISAMLVTLIVIPLAYVVTKRWRNKDLAHGSDSEI
ncbi:MAG: CusA/CzcA family heavy metal efflux RND transporter [Pseudomonadales bacterium]|jgi:Cu(I)/Ag(I) efflux system membrane protein CusA/SilA